MAALQWYTLAKRYKSLRERGKISPQLAATLRRIAKLPPTIGETLEKAGVGRHKFAWVAWGETVTERERRFAEVLASLANPYGKDSGRWWEG